MVKTQKLTHSIRFTPDALQELTYMAESQDTSVSKIVRQAVDQYLNSQIGNSIFVKIPPLYYEKIEKLVDLGLEKSPEDLIIAAIRHYVENITPIALERLSELDERIIEMAQRRVNP